MEQQVFSWCEIVPDDRRHEHIGMMKALAGDLTGERNKLRHSFRPRPGSMPDMPAHCDRLLLKPCELETAGDGRPFGSGFLEVAIMVIPPYRDRACRPAWSVYRDGAAVLARTLVEVALW